VSRLIINIVVVHHLPDPDRVRNQAAVSLLQHQLWAEVEDSASDRSRSE
jgi:hypothetical protein